MSDHLVSIILPTFNRVNYVVKAIQSILSQNYSDWELIIWNDGSEDNSEEVINSFKDERIKYYHDVNHGKSYALNRAIELSEGEYIAFIDDDDQWHENKLNLQIKIFSKYPEVDILFTDFNNMNLSTGEKGSGFEQTIQGLERLIVNEIDDDLFIIEDNFPEGITITNFILPSSTVLRKAVLQKVGQFNEELRNSLDLELWWRIYLHGFSFAYLKKILVDRIKPFGSLSSSGITNYRNVIKCLDSCIDESKKFGRQDLDYLIRTPYRNAWLGILREFAKSGERKEAFQAFINSIRYGVNARGLYLLMGAMAGPKIINSIKKK